MCICVFFAGSGAIMSPTGQLQADGGGQRHSDACLVLKCHIWQCFPILVLKTHRPAYFPCFSAPANLIQMDGSGLQKAEEHGDSETMSTWCRPVQRINYNRVNQQFYKINAFLFPTPSLLQVTWTSRPPKPFLSSPVAAQWVRFWWIDSSFIGAEISSQQQNWVERSRSFI